MVRDSSTFSTTRLRELEDVRSYVSVRPGAPLGFDRKGRQYWILNVQESASLLPYSAGMNTATGQLMRPDASVLVKDTTGLWYYQVVPSEYVTTPNQPSFATPGAAARSLLFGPLSLDIPCERILYQNMTERIAIVRRKLQTSFCRLKPVQADWIRRYILSDNYMNSFRVAAHETKQLVWTLETLYMKSLEVRSFIYFSQVLREEDDRSGDNRSVRAEREAILRRTKKIRDLFQDEYYDLGLRGWTSGGLFNRIRTLVSTTVASRLLADPGQFGLFQSRAQQCVVRRNMFSVTSPPFSSQLTAAAASAVPPNSSTVITRAIAPPVVASTLKLKPAPWSKHVEMCHPATGEVLRVFPSQKDAAIMLNVSQGGISQCCSGIKPDAYGFKWRFYEGPQLDCKYMISYFFLTAMY